MSSNFFNLNFSIESFIDIYITQMYALGMFLSYFYYSALIAPYSDKIYMTNLNPFP